MTWIRRSGRSDLNSRRLPPEHLDPVAGRPTSCGGWSMLVAGHEPVLDHGNRPRQVTTNRGAPQPAAAAARDRLRE